MLIATPGKQRLGWYLGAVLDVRRAEEAGITQHCLGAAQLPRQFGQLLEHRDELTGIGRRVDEADGHDQHRVGIHRGLGRCSSARTRRSGLPFS